MLEASGVDTYVPLMSGAGLLLLTCLALFLLPMAPFLWPLPDGDIAYERRVQMWWGRWSVPFQAIHSADPSLCVWAGVRTLMPIIQLASGTNGVRLGVLDRGNQHPGPSFMPAYGHRVRIRRGARLASKSR